MNTGAVILLIFLIILILVGLGIGLYFLLRKKTPTTPPTTPPSGGTGTTPPSGGTGTTPPSGGTGGFESLIPSGGTGINGGNGGTEPGPIISQGGYFGPSLSVWTDNLCPNIGSFSGVNLAQCQSLCNSTENCNALEFNGNPEPSGTAVCILRACSTGTQPNTVLPRFSGFAKYPI